MMAMTTTVTAKKRLPKNREATPGPEARTSGRAVAALIQSS
jgi:hypothetical protein